MTEAIAAIIGVVVGAGIAELLRINGEIGRQRSWWATLRASLLQCSKMANTYCYPEGAREQEQPCLGRALGT